MTKAAGKPQEVTPAKTDAQLIAEARTLAAHNDLEGLRRLYAQAERSKVAKATLEGIEDISNIMKNRMHEEAQAIVHASEQSERQFLGDAN
jgi:Zn-dependent M16 (insulinase) family peptidase